MKYSIFKLKKHILDFIFVTIIYNLIRILYRISLYYPNELIYRCCVFVYADCEKTYNIIVRAESVDYKENRLSSHILFTFIEAVILLLVVYILHDRGIK